MSGILGENSDVYLESYRGKMNTESKPTNKAMVFKMDPIIESTLRKANDHKIHGEYEAALALYDLILEKQPNHSGAILSKGNALDLMGQYPEAIKCYDDALICDPHNAEVWYNKGVTLKKMGLHEEGSLHIRKGLSLSVGEI
jgi:tetratricopeptide (TPR) repeat protein